MAIKENEASSSPLLTLFCEEENWEDEEEEEPEQSEVSNCNNNGKNGFFFPIFELLDQDLFWEDEELETLFSKEEKIHGSCFSDLARREAVEWMLKVNAFYGFTAVTAVLAVNYFDRFLRSVQFRRDKPWTVQLVAVTCLSLAAKVEETQVPLLLDLQVEDTKYVFEAKTIQKMELLLLSTLEWKMHPLTPVSFLDHILRRLGLRTQVHWEFLRRCERLLLSAITDSRFVGHLPSTVAAATMMRVIDQVEPCNAVDYQDQLLGVLKISKEKVKDCYELITELSNSKINNKRKYYEYNEQFPSSPIGVIDASFSSNNDSSSSSSSSSSSVCSSAETEHALFKKTKKSHQQEHLVNC